MERIILQDCARIALQWAELHEKMAAIENDTRSEKHAFAAEQIRLLAATFLRDAGEKGWESVLKRKDGLDLIIPDQTG